MQARLTEASQSFFSQNDRARYTQYYNLAVAGFAVLGYFTNPNASFLEYGTDVAVHLLQACVTENTPNLNMAASAANGVRLFSIGFSGILNNSTIKPWLNVIDIGNHAYNLLHNSQLAEQQPSAPRLR